VLGLTVVIALNNVGYDVAALLAGLGIGGLAMAMAAKDTVSNVFGGVTIFTDQPFTINDRIRASGFDGTVEEIGVRSTRIRTLDGTLVTIPNSSFAESAVENVSAEPSRKVKVNLGLTYDTTPEQMQEAMTILADIADGNDGLLENRTISFNAFGDSAMNIIFIYYIKKGAAIMDVQTEINMEILSRFNARGLEFAFPTQTIYTRAETAT
jgi:MscS family membrane protein